MPARPGRRTRGRPRNPPPTLAPLLAAALSGCAPLDRWIPESTPLAAGPVLAAILLFGGVLLARAERRVRQLNESLERRVAERTAELDLANAARLENETRLRAVLDNAQAVIFLKDRAGHYLLANRRYAELFGLSPEGIPGKTDADFFPQDIAARLRANDRQVQEQGIPLVFEEAVALADSEPRTYIVTKFPLRDAQGRLHAVGGIATDITDRKRAEAALQSSEERLKLGIQVAGLALAEIDYGADLARLTPEAARLFGLGGAALSLPRAVLHARFHPDDRPALLDHIAESLNPQGPGWFEQDHRVLWPDGQTRWLRVRKQVLFAGEGAARRPVRAMLAALDVTAWKTAAEAVRRSEAFVRGVLDSLPQQVVVLDQTGAVRAVNASWQRFARENGGMDTDLSGGTNYLEVCRRAVASGDPYAREALDALEGILAGRCESCAMEYPCHAPDRERWFLLQARRLLYGTPGLILSHIDITQRKQAEEALRHSEERYRLIVENASEGIWLMDGDHRTTFVNPAMARMLGYAPEEMLGTPLENHLHPDEESAQYRQQQALLRAGKTAHYQHRLRRKDGSPCWCQVSAAPLIDAEGRFVGSLALKTDITESKLAAEALRESEARFRALFELSSDALVLTDTQGFLDGNAAALKLFGCAAREDLLGRHPAWLSPPTQPDGTDSQRLAQERIATALAQGSLRFEWQHRRRDGSEFPAEVVLTRVELQGRPVLQGSVRDITERQAMLAALARAKEEAERANQSKSLFLANMSHEIRTPINAIMGMTELCLTESIGGRQRNFLAKIGSASQSLLHVIDDILDFSKIEAGKLDLVAEPFTLAGLRDGLVSLLTGKAQEKSLELVFELPPGLDGPLVGDPRRLGQILVNLMGNAIKFSQRGQVTLAVTEQSRENGQTTLRFAVHDQGIGIAPEEQARLFQPFTQADASTTRSYGGTGLGLAISKRLVELMGGQIGVDSALGRGSTFYFTARFALGDGRELPANLRTRRRAAWNTTVAQAGLRGAEILVVEDAPLSQEVMAEFLERAGFRVRLAANGEEALRQVAEAVPDAVLMDCQMPVMDGYEATRRLRAEAPYRELPIIALTANAMAGDRERCLAAGMNGFVTKPVNFQELLAALACWIRPRPVATPPAPVPAAPAALPALPGIDTAQGLLLVGERPAFYLRLLRKFRDTQAGDFPAQFRAALAADDWTETHRLAHSLKGTARTLGATALGELAGRLESAALTREPDQVAEWLEPLVEELDRVLAGLAQLDSAGLDAAARPPGTAIWRGLCAELDRLLENHAMEAVDGVARLELSMAGSGHRNAVRAIAQAIARDDFAEARERLGGLARALDFPRAEDDS